MKHKLTYPAPWSDKALGNDGYYSIPWTAESIAAYEAAGGWFREGLFGYHPYYSMAPGVRTARKQHTVPQPALKPSRMVDEAMKKLASKLTPSERMLLLAQLEAS